MQRPATRTPLTVEGMGKYLEEAFIAEYGRALSRPEAEWLLALLRHENANGESIIAYNWGNRVATQGEDFWVPSWADESITKEELSPRTRALRESYIEGNAVPGKFAAYASHAEGARKFVRLFRSQTHKRILDAAAADNARAFWRGIGEKHPITKKRYCEECLTEATFRTYSALHDQNKQAGYFAHLKAVPGGKPGETAPAEDLSSAFSDLLEQVGSYREGNVDTVWEGSRGPAVAILQGALGAHIDSRYGPKTKRAVLGFQTRSGLKVDGVCGPQTWTALANRIQLK